MRLLATAIILLLLAPVAVFAGTPPYQTALVTSMRMVQCAEPPRHGGFLSNFVVGSGPPIPAGPSECPEYEIEGPRVTYRIRPRRDLLLPVGDEIKFRIFKRDLLVLTEDANKEVVFSVVGMTLRNKNSASPMVVADGTPEVRPRKCLTMEGEIVTCGKN